MKKDQIIVAGLIVMVAVGLVLFGRADNAPTDGMVRIKEALKAQEVAVVVVTDGRAGAQGEFLGSIKQAVAGTERVRVIHVDKQNPVEREAMGQFPSEQLPTFLVLGLDGVPTLAAGTVDAAAVKTAVADGLTKTPVKIEEHAHTDSCGHGH